METIRDFEDMLLLLEKHGVRYMVVGGLAFIFHAKPRYTKDMDLWIEFGEQNIQRTNAALVEFGSSLLLSVDDAGEVLQLGVAPDRIDFLLRMEGVSFEDAWARRIRAPYGEVEANWIGLDSLLTIKSGIDKPRHQEDARVLREVKKLKGG